MNDPAHTTMSWLAVLVLTVVVLVAIVGWLAVIFHVGRDGGGSARRAEHHPGHAGQPGADAPGEVPPGQAG